MNIRAIKYLFPASMYVLAMISFQSVGWLAWSALFYAWIILPLAELFIKPREANLSAAEAELAKKEPMYDYMLYFFVVLQYVALGLFLLSFRDVNLSAWDVAGRIGSMGLLCGSFGINIGHELGHRTNPLEQTLAKAALLSSLYMHFFIEHNKGHHKHVATPQDPSSARYNEPVYTFYFRTIIFSYLSAWKIANSEIRKKGLSILHWKNEMIQVHVIQLAFVLIIFLGVGATVMLYYLCAAVIGILLLETVNYIEHYGLQRKKTGDKKYERAMPVHSWNSNHILGRIMLFELSRHSDHHYLASKKYQLLDNHMEAPQLPTGYPGSMILSLFPPAWFFIMNRRIKRIQHLQ